jgi:hypothetical protein
MTTLLHLSYAVRRGLTMVLLYAGSWDIGPMCLYLFSIVMDEYHIGCVRLTESILP